MKHRAFTILNENLHEATHNHDSIGRCVGRMVDGKTKQDAHNAVAALPEIGHHRFEAMQSGLRAAGIIQ